MLVLVDDCQWADPESLRFLAYLGQRIEGLPVAMVLAGRPPDPRGRRVGVAVGADRSSRPEAVALYPRPLSESAAEALTRERLGNDAAEEFCRACHTATGGNPLFLRELLGPSTRPGWRRRRSAANEVQAVGPAAVSRFVLHRLAALGPLGERAGDTRSRCSATTASSQLAADVAGLSEDAAREAADDLVRADIFADGERLGFVHPIVRAALYEDLAPGRAPGAARGGGRGADAAGRLVRARHRTPAADARRPETRQGADAQVGGDGGGADAAPRARPPRVCDRALDESPGGAGAGGDPGRAGSLRGGRDAIRGGRSSICARR